jgi:hypothetical protein
VGFPDVLCIYMEIIIKTMVSQKGKNLKFRFFRGGGRLNLEKGLFSVFLTEFLGILIEFRVFTQISLKKNIFCGIILLYVVV